MRNISTFDMNEALANAEVLYTLFNMFGRGRVTEDQFVILYLKSKLPEFIKKVLAERKKE